MRFPLYVVTGVSGSGKSTVAIELSKVLRDYSVYDMDLLVIDDNYKHASINWMRVAHWNTLSARGTVLFGNVPFSFSFEGSEYLDNFDIRYIHLYSYDSILQERLLKRGGDWEEKENIDAILSLARNALYQAVLSQAFIVDNSGLHASQITYVIKMYILKCQGNFPLQ